MTTPRISPVPHDFAPTTSGGSVPQTPNRVSSTVRYAQVADAFGSPCSGRWC